MFVCFVCVSVCLLVCAWERERERERENLCMIQELFLTTPTLNIFEPSVFLPFLFFFTVTAGLTTPGSCITFLQVDLQSKLNGLCQVLRYNNTLSLSCFPRHMHTFILSHNMHAIIAEWTTPGRHNTLSHNRLAIMAECTAPGRHNILSTYSWNTVGLGHDVYVRCHAWPCS